MANVFDKLHKLTHTPEAIAARQARRAHKQTTMLDRIAGALGHVKEADSWDIQDMKLESHPLGDTHPGVAAAMYVREALGQFELPDKAQVTYTGMKRMSGSGQHNMRDGVVMVKAELRSLSGAKHSIDIPVMVHAGRMVYPEIFLHNGRTRIMAQSAFDDIVGAGEIMRPQFDREHMYSAPPPHEHTLQTRSKPQTPQIGIGMYGLRAALRGYRKTGMMTEDEMFEQFDRDGYIALDSDEVSAGRHELFNPQNVKFEWNGDYTEVRVTPHSPYNPHDEEMTFGQEHDAAGPDDGAGPHAPATDPGPGTDEPKPMADPKPPAADPAPFAHEDGAGPNMPATGARKQAGPDGQAYIEGTPNATDAKNVGWQGNPNDDHLDEAERDRSGYLTPGQVITLANEIMLKGRGGATQQLKSGAKGTVVRDMLGTGQVYYVEFDSGTSAPVNREDIA